MNKLKERYNKLYAHCEALDSIFWHKHNELKVLYPNMDNNINVIKQMYQNRINNIHYFDKRDSLLNIIEDMKIIKM